MNDVRPYVGMWKICMKILINKFLNLENNSNSFFTILNGYFFLSKINILFSFTRCSRHNWKKWLNYFLDWMARDWPFVNFIFFNINYVGYTKRKMEGKSIIIAYKYKIFFQIYKGKNIFFSTQKKLAPQKKKIVNIFNIIILLIKYKINSMNFLFKNLF